MSTTPQPNDQLLPNPVPESKAGSPPPASAAPAAGPGESSLPAGAVQTPPAGPQPAAGSPRLAAPTPAVPPSNPVLPSFELSAFRVMDGSKVPNRDPMPGQLYFYAATDYPRAIPPDQERAHQEIEKVCSVLRIAFQQDEPRLFEEFFLRLLTAAQATFSATGFRPEALGDLPVFKQEVVPLAIR